MTLIMTANFPNSEYQPRAIENVPGTTYDPADKKRLFAEDINNMNDEIKAIEQALSPNSSEPLPYGFTVGGEYSQLEINKILFDGVEYPLLKPLPSDDENLKFVAMENGLAFTVGPNGLVIFPILDVDNQLIKYFAFIFALNLWVFQGNLMVQNLEADSTLTFQTVDENDEALGASFISYEYLYERFNIANKIRVTGGVESFGDVTSSTYVDATTGYKINGTTGKTATVSVVVDTRMNYGTLQKKTRTLTYTGGILTNEGTVSGWVNA